MIATGRPSPPVTPPRMARSVWGDISPHPIAPRSPRERVPTPSASPRHRPTGRPRPGSGGCRRAKGRAGPEDPGDFLAVERLALEQRARQRVQLFEILFEDLPRPVRAVADAALDRPLALVRRIL